MHTLLGVENCVQLKARARHTPIRHRRLACHPRPDGPPRSAAPFPPAALLGDGKSLRVSPICKAQSPLRPMRRLAHAKSPRCLPLTGHFRGPLVRRITSASRIGRYLHRSPGLNAPGAAQASAALRQARGPPLPLRSTKKILSSPEHTAAVSSLLVRYVHLVMELCTGGELFELVANWVRFSLRWCFLLPAAIFSIRLPRVASHSDPSTPRRPATRSRASRGSSAPC